MRLARCAAAINCTLQSAFCEVIREMLLKKPRVALLFPQGPYTDIGGAAVEFYSRHWQWRIQRLDVRISLTKILLNILTT